MINDHYNMGDKKHIGTSHSNIFKTMHKITKEYRCVKILLKNKIKNPFKVMHEINILKEFVKYI